MHWLFSLLSLFLFAYLVAHYLASFRPFLKCPQPHSWLRPSPGTPTPICLVCHLSLSTARREGVCLSWLGLPYRIPQTGGLNDRHLFLAVLEAVSLRSACPHAGVSSPPKGRQDWVLWRLLGGICFLPFLASGGTCIPWFMVLHLSDLCSLVTSPSPTLTLLPLSLVKAW